MFAYQDRDAIDAPLGEYVQRVATAPWLATYRLLSKGSPCITEVDIRMAQPSEFERSCTHVLLYPPQPARMILLEGRQSNFFAKMYGLYLQEKRQQVAAGHPVCESFLVWHLCREHDDQTGALKYRGGKHQQATTKTQVVACLFSYELTDGYWGQFCVTHLPHQQAEDLLPGGVQQLECMQNFASMLVYLCSWRWAEDEGVMETAKGFTFNSSARPLIIDDQGWVQPVGRYEPGIAVFADDTLAFAYLLSLTKRDLQFREMRDDRFRCFAVKQEANFLLYPKVRVCLDAHEYSVHKQAWGTVSRPKYRDLG